MIKNKRGQIFTVIAIVLLLLLFVTFSVSSGLSDRKVIKSRVSTMDNYIFSLEENMNRQAHISGFRIVFLALDEITRTNQFIDLESFSEEAFFNGTVNGEEKDILLGATYEDIVSSLDENARKLNMDILFENVSVSFSQEDPWNIIFSFEGDLVITDSAGLAKWERYKVASASIPISSFDDPLFLVYTNSKISRKINETIYAGNYGSEGNVSNFESHVLSGYYAYNPDAPSFLNRLEGNFSSDENGIESFVNILELSNQGISIEEKSVVDHIYFSSSDPIYFSVDGMPTWFRIDSEHLNYYLGN
jgi:hypothetical protein